MIKVKFIKDHVNGIKAGDTGEFELGRADYLVRVGSAEYVSTDEVKKEVKKTRKKEGCKTC